jgi:uncharacterized membrane protein
MANRAWLFKRNCSFTPKQVGLFYLAQSSFALFVATFFYLRGVWVVLIFTIAVLIVLAIALLIYARHTTDFESIDITGQTLVIRIANGSNIKTFEWNLSWVYVSPRLTDKHLVLMSYRGVECLLGGLLPAYKRQPFLSELKEAIRISNSELSV